MIEWFTIFASNRSLLDCCEESFQCNTLWAALKKFREYRRKGYEVIDIHYRKTTKFNTESWNDITVV